MLLLGLGVLLSVIGCARRSPGEGEPLAAFVSHLERRLPAHMDRHHVPGVAIALVRGAEVVWAGAYGYSDVEQRRDLSLDALFRVESISKSVTAWGVMTLVERGLLSLEDPVHLHLGAGVRAVEAVGPEVTVARLLSNSAGLPLGPIGEEYAPGDATPSLEEYVAREARLVSEPGSRFIYSNVGYALLELVVEEVTGRDFAEYIREEVLLPLGMYDSTFSWDEALRASLPTGYDLGGTPVPPYVYPVRASGGLLATVRDVARFVAASVVAPGADVDRGLEAVSVRELHAPRVGISGLYGFVADAYGAGHFVEELRDGRRAVWHGGQGHGWMSHFHAVPGTGEGIVILTNSQRSWPLMAEVLTAWARWTGLGPLGMSAITYATTALRFAIGLSALASVWLLLRLVLGIRSGVRRLSPLSRAGLAPRLFQSSLGMTTLAGLTWAAAQPYLFVSSVFPGVTGWAAASFGALAVVLIASALFPRPQGTG